MVTRNIDISIVLLDTLLSYTLLLRPCGTGGTINECSEEANAYCYLPYIVGGEATGRINWVYSGDTRLSSPFLII